MGSNLPVVEKEHLNAGVIRGIKSAIRRSRLALRARERFFDRVKVVKMQGRDQVNIGRSGDDCDRTVADLVCPETRNRLDEGYVSLEIVLFERFHVSRLLVDN